jgi:uncharacterized protein (DUF1330 family)
VPLRAAR